MIRHLAIIMDGNGRWAKKRGKMRLAGHRAGAETLDRVMGYCRDAGIEYLTVYAFSTENWKRSKEEVSGLMKLLGTFIKSKEKSLVENSVRFRMVGRRDDLPKNIQKSIAALEKKTEEGRFTLLVALSYGGRAEITDAANEIARRAAEGWSRTTTSRRSRRSAKFPERAPATSARQSAPAAAKRSTFW